MHWSFIRITCEVWQSILEYQTVAQSSFALHALNAKKMWVKNKTKASVWEFTLSKQQGVKVDVSAERQTSTSVTFGVKMKAFALTVAALLGRALATPTCPPPVTWQVPDTTRNNIVRSLWHTPKLIYSSGDNKRHVLHLQRPWKQRLQQGRVPHHPCASLQHVSRTWCHVKISEPFVNFCQKWCLQFAHHLQCAFPKAVSCSLLKRFFYHYLKFK